MAAVGSFLITMGLTTLLIRLLPQQTELRDQRL